jgi:hypothetical protein
MRREAVRPVIDLTRTLMRRGRAEVLLAACDRFEKYASAVTATVAYCSPRPARPATAIASPAPCGRARSASFRKLAR